MHYWSPKGTCAIGRRRARALQVAEGRVHYWSPKGACAIGCQRACALSGKLKGYSPINKAPVQRYYTLYKELGLLVICLISSKVAFGSLLVVFFFVLFEGGGFQEKR